MKKQRISLVLTINTFDTILEISKRTPVIHHNLPSFHRIIEIFFLKWGIWKKASNGGQTLLLSRNFIINILFVIRSTPPYQPPAPVKEYWMIRWGQVTGVYSKRDRSWEREREKERIIQRRVVWFNSVFRHFWDHPLSVQILLLHLVTKKRMRNVSMATALVTMLTTLINMTATLAQWRRLWRKDSDFGIMTATST